VVSVKDYYTNNYRKLGFIALLLFLPLLFLVFVFPGIHQGIDLTGGNVLIIRSNHELSEQKIMGVLKDKFNLSASVSTISSPSGFGAYIEYEKDEKVLEAESLIEKAQFALDEENEAESISFSVQAIKLLSSQDVSFDNPKLALGAAQEALVKNQAEFFSSLESTLTSELGLGDNIEFQRKEVSPTLGKASFQSGLFIAICSAIALIGIIFLFFRQIIPVAGIVQAMVFDVLAGLATMALFNIPLSLLTISTLLMVVGYSVDTDIMLTSRMLKDKSGSPGQKATSAFKTGLTMTLTSCAALVGMVIISSLFSIDVVFQIAVVLLCGQIGDIFSTWLMNASILMWFVEKVKK
jgi:preprotein translocase subunit SecF